MHAIADRWRRETRADLLLSPAFIAALAVLVANDFVLKQAYPGLVTGKLSDFAGLFAVAIVAFALRPNATRISCIAITAAFAWLKSPLSQPALDAWNGAIPYHLGRVVDGTDLIALISLPFALTCARVLHGPRAGAALRGPMLVVSGAVFVGSLLGGVSNETIYQVSPEDPSATYVFPFAANELAQRLDDTGCFMEAKCRAGSIRGASGYARHQAR